MHDRTADLAGSADGLCGGGRHQETIAEIPRTDRQKKSLVVSRLPEAGPE